MPIRPSIAIGTQWIEIGIMLPSLRTHQSRSMRIGSPRRVACVIGQSSAGKGDPSGCL